MMTLGDSGQPLGLGNLSRLFTDPIICHGTPENPTGKKMVGVCSFATIFGMMILNDQFFLRRWNNQPCLISRFNWPKRVHMAMGHGSLRNQHARVK